EESKMRLEIADLKIELEDVIGGKKELLKRILAPAETKHFELVEQRQKVENELQDFVSSVLKLAEQFAQQTGPTTPRLGKARELFNQGLYMEVDKILNTQDIYSDIEAHRER